MNNFNRYRSPALPELQTATAALLEVVWEDDFESCGLVSPTEDKPLFDLVVALDAAVIAEKSPTLSEEEITALKESGWHDAEGVALAAMDKFQTEDGYPSKVWAILEDIFTTLMDADC